MIKILVGVLLIIILVCLMQNKKETFIVDYVKKIQKNAQTTQNTIANNKLQKISKNTIGGKGIQGLKGLDGTPGTRGPPGDKGQLFLHKGPLRNLETNNFLDRQFWDNDLTNVEANAFMTKKSYYPEQYWELTEDNKLRNQYGGWTQCLNTDGEKIFMGDCNETDTQSSWQYNKYGMLKSKHHTTSKGSMCLTTNKDNKGNETLRMKTCDIINYPKSQLWNFY